MGFDFSFFTLSRFFFTGILIDKELYPFLLN